MAVEARYSGKCAGCGFHFSVGTMIEKRDDRWYVVDCKACEYRKQKLYLGRDQDGKGAVDCIHDMLTWYDIFGHLGPSHHNQELITITLYNKFEAYTHEAWDDVWIVALHAFRHEWYQDGKYQTIDHPKQEFRGETLEKAIQKCTQVIREQILDEEKQPEGEDEP